MSLRDTVEGAASGEGWLGFALPQRDARGRLVRLGPVLDTILAAHAYPPAIAHCLAEALVLTALMGTLLKERGDQLTMQAQCEGGLVRLMVCDYRDGELRGYAEQEPGSEGALAANLSLERLFGRGYLAITFDIASSGQRYQGIVPLTGASLSGAVEHYFAQSEQVPTMVRSAIRNEAGHWRGGGMLVQHLPEGEEGRERLHVRFDDPQWEHVAILGETVSHAELLDPALPLDALLWRLFHQERGLLAIPGSGFCRGCRCTEAHFESVLARFPKADRREMADENGVIVVDCAFCSRQFHIAD